MENQISPKLKIMYLMKILLEKTDEEHYLTMPEIIKALEAYGISAERKSVYNDVELLIFFGLDIVKVQRGKNFYYYVGSRDFELAELKLLVDSVQAARFITEKKSNALIKKIETLTSHHEAQKLQRQVYVAKRVKAENEKILYNIDAIHNAIAQNSVITFRYFNWNADKQMELRRNGQLYCQSPWALTLAEENYYLVAYDSVEKEIKHFRVDKMVGIELTHAPREGKEQFDRFDIAAYTKKRFRMYSGEEKQVTLLCNNDYAGVIIDRFGRDIPMRRVDDDHFVANVNVAVSNQFLAWVLSMSEGVKISAPEDVVGKVKQFIATCAKSYE